MKVLLIIATFLCSFHTSMAQLKPVYVFQKDDTILRKKIADEAKAQYKQLESSLTDPYKKDYKEIYKLRQEEVTAILGNSRLVTAPEPYDYLQSLLKKITDANPELQKLPIRLVFTRDKVPNAASMGEGTLVVNAGLFIYLKNEAELIFVICHEIAHYYLDHSNRKIRKNIELINSKEYKEEIKRITKQEFGVMNEIRKLAKKFSFDNSRHSREYETEADKYAYQFMKKTGADCGGIKTCLQMMDIVDDSLLYQPVKLEHTFNFSEYLFKKKWVQKESVIFGQLKEDDSPVSKREKDSLKTHPDCEKRIHLLEDSIKLAGKGAAFIADESLFFKLKKDFFIEISEQQYKEENLGSSLYYSLMLLQNNDNTPYAVFSIARALNGLYQAQKDHRLGLVAHKETRGYPEDYNLLLRMLDRVKLDEIASLNYYFCRQYYNEMKGYEGWDAELKKALETKIDN